MLTTFMPILAFATPLGADSACVCAALSARQRIVWRRRLIIAGTLTAFEAGTPALGMLLSGPAGHYLGGSASYIAGALLVLLGLWMLLHGGDDSEGPDLGTAAGLLPLLAVGVAVSIDEIAVGVSLGIAGVPVVPLMLTVAVWVFAATMTGLTIGAKLGERFQRHAGTAASVALIGLGVALALHIL